MDLHIHSCLSPCGELSMTPPAIVARAMLSGLDAIGITDHNCARNAQAVRTAGGRIGMNVLSGMEICSREEAHLLAFFDDQQSLGPMQDLVFSHLAGENNPGYFGDQVVADADGNPVDIEERLLIGACDLSVEEIIDAVHERGGIAIGAHLDRHSYSLVSQLGFVPEGLCLDAVELSADFPVENDAQTWLDKVGAGGYPHVCFSDAHRIEDIGRASTAFLMEDATVAELGMALRGENGRRVEDR